MLDLAKKLFEDQTSLDRMVTKIMMQSTELVKCERCTVLLLDTNNKVCWIVNEGCTYEASPQHLTFSNMFIGGGADYKRLRLIIINSTVNIRVIVTLYLLICN